MSETGQAIFLSSARLRPCGTMARRARFFSQEVTEETEGVCPWLALLPLFPPVTQPGRFGHE